MMNKSKCIHYTSRGTRPKSFYSEINCISDTQRAIEGSSGKFIVKGLRRPIDLMYDPPTKYNHRRSPNYFYDILYAVTNLDSEFKKLEDLFSAFEVVDSKQNGVCREENLLTNDLKYINLAANSLLELITGLKKDLLNQVEVVEGTRCEGISSTKYLIIDLEIKLHDLLKKVEQFKVQFGKEPSPFTTSMINVHKEYVMKKSARIFQEIKNVCKGSSHHNRFIDNCNFCLQSNNVHTCTKQQCKKRKIGFESVPVNRELLYKIPAIENDELSVNTNSKLSKIKNKSKGNNCKYNLSKIIISAQDNIYANNSQIKGDNLNALLIGGGDANSNSSRVNRRLVSDNFSSNRRRESSRNKQHTSKNDKSDVVKRRKRAGRDKIYNQSKSQHLDETRRHARQNKLSYTRNRKKYSSQRTESESENKTDMSDQISDRRKQKNKVVLHPSSTKNRKHQVYLSQSSHRKQTKQKERKRSTDSFVSKKSPNRFTKRSNSQPFSDRKLKSRFKSKHGNNSEKGEIKSKHKGELSYKSRRVRSETLSDRDSNNKNRSSSNSHEKRNRDKTRKVRSRNGSKDRGNNVSGFRTSSSSSPSTLQSGESSRSFSSPNNIKQSENNADSKYKRKNSIKVRSSSKSNKRFLRDHGSNDRTKKKIKLKDRSKSLRRNRRGFGVQSSKSKPRRQSSSTNRRSKNRSGKHRNQSIRAYHKNKPKRRSSKRVGRTRSGFGVQSSKSYPSRSLRKHKKPSKDRTDKNTKRHKIKPRNRSGKRSKTPSGFSIYSSKSNLSRSRPQRKKGVKKKSKTHSRSHENQNKKANQLKHRDHPRKSKRHRNFSVYSSKSKDAGNTSESSDENNFKYSKNRSLPNKTTKNQSILKMKSQCLKRLTSNQNILYNTSETNDKMSEHFVCLNSRKMKGINCCSIVEPIICVKPENQCYSGRKYNICRTLNSEIPRGHTKYCKANNKYPNVKECGPPFQSDADAQCNYTQYFKRAYPLEEVCFTTNKPSRKSELEYELLPIHSPNLKEGFPEDLPLEIHDICSPNIYCQSQLEDERLLQEEEQGQNSCYVGEKMITKIYKFPRRESTNPKKRALKRNQQFHITKIDSNELGSQKSRLTSSEEEIHVIKQSRHEKRRKRKSSSMEVKRGEPSLSTLSKEIKSISLNRSASKTKTSTRNKTRLNSIAKKQSSSFIGGKNKQRHILYRQVPTIKEHRKYRDIHGFPKESSAKIVEYECRDHSSPSFQTPLSIIKDIYHYRGSNRKGLPPFDTKTPTIELSEYIKNIGTNTEHIRDQGTDPMPEREKLYTTCVETKTAFTNTDKMNTRDIGIECIPENPKPKMADTAVDPLCYIGQKNVHTDTIERKKSVSNMGMYTKSTPKVQRATMATDPLYYLGQREKQTSTTPITTTNGESAALPKAMMVSRGTNPGLIETKQKRTSYYKINSTGRGKDPSPDTEDEQFYTQIKKPKIKSFYAVTNVNSLTCKTNAPSCNRSREVKPSMQQTGTQRSTIPQPEQPEVPHCIGKSGSSPSGLSVQLLFEKFHDKIHRRCDKIYKTSYSTNNENKQYSLVCEKKNSNTIRANNRSDCQKRKVEKTKKCSPTIGLDLSVKTRGSSHTNNTNKVYTNPSTNGQDELPSVDYQGRTKLRTFCEHNRYNEQMDGELYVSHKYVFNESTEYRDICDFGLRTVNDSCDTISTEFDWKVVANEVKDSRRYCAKY